MSYATKSARPQYTRSEIQQCSPELPGFESPGDIFDIFTSPQHSLWQPVLSTTIVSRLDDRICVLTGNRTAIGNTTHVNVASTPTMRVPYEEAGLLIGEHIPFYLSRHIEPLRPFISGSLSPSVARLPDNSDLLSAKVTNLLALKLGLGPPLEVARHSIGRASMARCIAGFSYLDDNSSGEPLFEPLIMFGAIVGLNTDIARMIPAATNSYNSISWTPADQYIHGVATRSLLDVLPNASPEDEIEVCIRGLCNVMSTTLLNDINEIQYHLTEKGILPEL